MTEVAAQMPRGFNIDMKVLVDQQLKFDQVRLVEAAEEAKGLSICQP
jgi:hypothetical protein